MTDNIEKKDKKRKLKFNNLPTNLDKTLNWAATDLIPKRPLNLTFTIEGNMSVKIDEITNEVINAEVTQIQKGCNEEKFYLYLINQINQLIQIKELINKEYQGYPTGKLTEADMQYMASYMALDDKDMFKYDERIGNFKKLGGKMKRTESSAINAFTRLKSKYWIIKSEDFIFEPCWVLRGIRKVVKEELKNNGFTPFSLTLNFVIDNE